MLDFKKIPNIEAAIDQTRDALNRTNMDLAKKEMLIDLLQGIFLISLVGTGVAIYCHWTAVLLMALLFVPLCFNTTLKSFQSRVCGQRTARCI